MALSITCSSTFTFPCPFTFRSTFKGTFLLCTVTYVNVYSSILCSYNVSYHRCRALWWFFSGPSVTWGWRSAAVGLIGCKRLWTESLQQNHTTSDQTLIVKVKITPTERDRKIDGQEETDRGGDTERRKQRETKKTERQGHTHTHTDRKWILPFELRSKSSSEYFSCPYAKNTVSSEKKSCRFWTYNRLLHVCRP